MPFFKGPEPLAQYLRGLGYTHLAFSPTLFSDTRREFGYGSEKRYLPYRNFAKLRPYLLDFMVNAEDLAWSYPAIYRDEELVVMDLRKPGPADTLEEPGR
jgi:hypothetical protein